MNGKNKGISLVSLIIIVISIIILISIVVNVGYNYIEESNRTETAAVLKLISSAASNRQNDIHIDANTYYVGYPLKESGLTNITGLPEDFTVEAEDLWYFIDAKSAESLGVRESDKYIENDLKSPSSEIVKMVLVDYVTGEAYLVEVNALFLDGTIEDSECNQSPDGVHAYSVQTCTKGSKCIYCGTPKNGHENGLGHNFLPATCTSAGICSRCGAINADAPAIGHSFPTNPVTGEELWNTDATRHWKECERCGTRKETEEHFKGYVRIKLSDSPEVYDAKYHRELCSICGWESVKTQHVIAYKITGTHSHRRYCELCEYSEEHSDSGWITEDPTYHWRECTEDCESSDGTIDCSEDDKIFKEEHTDENHDNICDTCLKSLDNVPPNPFDAPGSYAKVDQVTTNTIKVSAFTTDDDEGTGIKGYYFGINYNDGKGTNWTELIETGDAPSSYTYINLIHNRNYDIYVKAMDNGENYNDSFKIPNTITAKVPNVKGINGVPNGYVKEPFKIEFQPLDTTLPNLTIEYSTDGGETWVNETVELIINKETVELRARVKDNRLPEPNKGEVWGPLNITNLDQTPPKVTITPKDGDTPSILQTKHTAVVTLKDEKAGITAETKIEYAWALSNTKKPTTFLTATTSNKTTVDIATAEIVTPAGAMGEYYLWINEGIEDAVGNKTKEAICGVNRYNVDDQDVTLSEIRMYNANPAVEGKTDYVKTNGEVTVTFKVSKALKGAPTVKIAEVTVTDVTSVDRINWVAKITATTAMPEGKLSLNISNVITQAGKESANTYNEDDLIEGPVIYDDTLPIMENVDK